MFGSILAFTGPKNSGKTTCQEYVKTLSRKNNTNNRDKIHFENFANPLKKICRDHFGIAPRVMADPILKESAKDGWNGLSPREVMIALGNSFRIGFGSDIWATLLAKRCRERLIQGQHIAIGDLRFPDEIITLKNLMPWSVLYVVYVQRPEKEKALADAKTAGDPNALDVSESHYDFMFNSAYHVIDNSGDKKALYNEVQKLMQQIGIL